MAVAMKALKGFGYAGVRYKPGDIFKCRDRDVKLVIAALLAVEVDPQKIVPTYHTRHMEAEKPNMTVAELRAALETKGVYLPKGYIPKAELLQIFSKEGSS